jgi:hypothetical protein
VTIKSRLTYMNLTDARWFARPLAPEIRLVPARCCGPFQTRFYLGGEQAGRAFASVPLSVTVLRGNLDFGYPDHGGWLSTRSLIRCACGSSKLLLASSR